MEPETKEQLLQELSCLQKPMWGYKDVMTFFHCHQTKAASIVKTVMKKRGAAPFERHKVLADDVIEVEFGGRTTRDREIANRVSQLFGPTQSGSAANAGKGAEA